MANPWDNDPIVESAAPQFPGVIQGRPKQIDPVEAERLRLAQEAADRSNRAEARAERSEARAERAEGRGTEGQAKAAGFLQRAIGANSDFEDTGVGPRSLAGDAVADIVPGIVNKFDSPSRQQAERAQRDFIAAVLRLESGAAIAQSEFDNMAQTFFPQPGDGEEVLADKAAARRRAMQSLQLMAGPLGEQFEIPPPRAGGSDSNNWTIEDTVKLYGREYFDADGNPLGPEGGTGYDAEGNELGLVFSVSDDSPTAHEQEVKSRADALDEATGRYGGLDIARSGVSFGLADEAAGIGTALGAALTGDLNFASNYRMGRDVEEERLNRARSAAGPIGSTALEMLGGGGAIRNVAGVAGNIVRQGAGLGALGGFGYGRDLEGSAANALLGAAAGGAIGFAGQKVGSALANRQSRNFDPARAQQVAKAGEAEGVTVNRAMIDPRQENVFSGVEATRFGGPRVNQQMDVIEGQIEGRIQQLGGNRQPLDRVAVGDRVQRAGERFIADSRNVTNRKYQVAEKLAGDAKVQPVQSRAAADAMIRELSETGNLNSAEIKFLEGIRDDLGKPLSISALRSMRTKLRKKISKGDLVFGEDEARVLAIMDEAANDIRTGLSQQGKAQAADAFAAADTAYAARMDYINSTVQKLIGRRGANMSAEQVASKFESMARNDAEGLRKFWAALEPEERLDMQATFASALGRNNKGEFSPAIFLNNVGGSNRKMSERAIRTVFGKDGAQSVANLKALSTEVNRLNAMRNRSNTARGNNYNSWLLETLGFLGGGGAGIASGSGGIGTAATAAAGAVTMGGLKAGRDILNARMLMSPKIQKWVAQAPKTANPKAIDAHFGRLEAIARSEPALAGDIEALRQGIIRAANDNSGGMARSVAEEPQE